MIEFLRFVTACAFWLLVSCIMVALAVLAIWVLFGVLKAMHDDSHR